MAPPSPRRKGLRLALRLGACFLVAAIFALPASVVTTIMLNPLLGRLEARYGIELTGHSGPSDWIYLLVFGITTIAIFSAVAWMTRPRVGIVAPRATNARDSHERT